MASLFDIVEGWTQELGPFVLRVDGTPLPLTGFDVSLVLRPMVGGKPGTPVTLGGTTRVDSDQVTNPGAVYYKPAATDMKAKFSPYTIHWKVVDGSGNVVFFPNTSADTINVNTP